MRACWSRARGIAFCVAWCMGCSRDPARADGSIDCPVGWVAHSRGGCGPAVLACSESDAAASGACASWRSGASDGGGVADDGRGPFDLSPDGAILGRWVEPGAPGGPPREDWIPPGVPPRDFRPRGPDLNCPAGWSLDADGACAAQVRPSCPSGTGALPDGTCTRTGVGDCPTAPFADVSSEAGSARVAYVRDGADPATADGSVALPFARIADALAASVAAGWVLLAAGEYDAPGNLVRSVHIVGVCAARTVLRGVSTMASVVRAGAAGIDVDVRSVTIASRFGAVRAIAGGIVRLRSVHVASSVGVALVGNGMGSTLVAEDVFVDAPATASGTYGIGVEALDRAAVTLSRFSLQGASEVGILGTTNANVRVTDSVVARTQGLPRGEFGEAIAMQFGATAILTRVAVRGAREAGIRAVEPDSMLRVSFVDVSDVLEWPGRAGGSGALAERGGAIVGDHLRISGASFAGVVSARAMSSVQLESATIVGAAAPSSQRFSGANASDGAAITLDRAVIRRMTGSGVESSGGATLALTNTSIEDSRQTTDGMGGVAVTVQGGSRLTLAASRLVSGRTAIISQEAGTQVVVTDSLVEGFEGRMDGSAPAAMIAQLQGRIELRNVRSRDNRGGGATAFGTGSTVDVADAWIERTESAVGAVAALGLAAHAGGELRIARVRVDRAAVNGIVAYAASRIDVRDTVVSQTAGYADGSYGIGLVGRDGSTVTAERVLLVESGEVGLASVGPDTQVTFESGAVLRTRGAGALSGNFASMTIRRSVIVGNAGAGAVAFGPNALLTLEDTRIADTQPRAFGPFMGVFGRGVEANRASRIDLRGVLIERCHEFGVMVDEAFGLNTLRDVIVRDVRPTARGFGIGIALYDATLEVERVAVASVAGIGLASASVDVAPGEMRVGAQITGQHVFVRHVATSTIRFGDDGRQEPSGLPVAYALHVGESSRLVLRHVVADGAGIGVMNAGGSADLTGGLIAAMLDSALARRGPGSSTRLTEIQLVDNARSDEVTNASLPAASALPSPTSVCTTPMCM